ncbi:MAG: hypothetical protein K2X57_17675 [Xanthobacteraceae bacterium]|nr:hypothetical protein [Xanthobacteraceae bacterium]
MRVLLATVLLVSTSLCPLLAEEAAKAPPAASQTVPAPPDRNPAQPRDQPAERDRAGGDDREFNRDGRVRRGEGGSMGQADREMGFARKMQRDRDDYRDGDKDLGRYGDRDERSSRRVDRADQGRGYGDARDDEAPRRRVKVCIEYDNGDEYCRDQRR